MNVRTLILTGFFLSGVSMAMAEDLTDAETASPVSRAAADASVMVEAVDVPTSDVLDAGTFATTFRFYNEGGLMSRLALAPFRRVNLGISFDIQRFIGSGDPRIITPDVYFKLRAFDGSDILPALALGYDSQGYLYQRPAKKFLHQERGLYLVMSHEIFLPDLEFHGGVNVPDVDNDAKVYGFLASTFRITNGFALLLEYDNIRNGPENRFNAGGRFWVIPSFNIDIAARNIGRDSLEGAERILRLNYVAKFPF